jgi:uncharacterized RDD family membrane protein YckC
MNNPYAPPRANVGDVDPGKPDDYEYAGFWLRFVAFFIDSMLIGLITVPLLMSIYGVGYLTDETRGWFGGTAEVLISYVLPAVLTIVFWRYKQATPGKMLLSMRIVDAETLEPMTMGQSIGRYFAYIPAFMVFFLGLFWIGWDSRKQGWHDKLARTVVIRVFK